MAKTYFAKGGYWGDGTVYVRKDDGETYVLPAYCGPQEVEHSPTGFAWGYAGSGPAQLAWAILRDQGLSRQDARFVYQAFKFAVIADLPQESGWELSEDEIAAAVAKVREQRRGAE